MNTFPDDPVMANEPLIVVVSGPGGVGKGTVVSELLRQYPDELWLSRSWTTREQRPGEADDAYVFVDRQAFQDRLEAGGFLEHAEFLGNYYGTPTPPMDTRAVQILEIDVQGARQIMAQERGCLLIFLEAPSPEEQEARLRHRGDPEEKVAQRLAKAKEEASAGAELGAHPIVNSEIADTVSEMYQVIQSALETR